jgi:hypothetical protein
MAAAGAAKAEAQAAQWEQEMALAKRADELEKAAERYNAKAAALKLAPPAAKHARGAVLTVALDAHAAAEAAAAGCSGPLLGGLDLKGGVKPLLQEMKEAQAREAHAARVGAVELESALAAAAEARGERAAEIGSLQAQLRRLEEAHKRGKEGMDRRVAALCEQAEAMEADILAISTADAGRLPAAQVSELAAAAPPHATTPSRACPHPSLAPPPPPRPPTRSDWTRGSGPGGARGGA